MYTLTVTLTGTGGGRVVSSQAGIDCGPDCTETYLCDTKPITLTATSHAASAFSGWGGDCAGSGECVVTLSESTLVTAEFNRAGYVLFLPTTMR